TPDPYLFRTATESVPWGSSEFEAAGFLKGEPVDVIRGPLTGLPLPANAELVVEGEVPPPSVEERMEGPFGEFTGYYAGGEKARPVFRVQALYYRTNPILHGDPPLRPPVGHWGFASSTLLGVWEGLEKAGLPGVVGVYALPVGGSQGVVVSVRQQYAGHARQVGRVASALNHTFCKLVVVVDEDIDPSRPEEVLWAICTRTDPATTFEIETDCASSTLDPMIHPDEKTKQTIGGLTSSRALVIACRPWEWRDRFPPVNRNSEQLRRQTYDKWRGLIDAAPRSGSGASREKEHAGAI
ncbi:MAG TPA: UbiD family decarboxylase, partial [Chloroflexota bacterium]|nr:UbiD family decarboxylase [Chloroflexota bacterium]